MNDPSDDAAMTAETRRCQKCGGEMSVSDPLNLLVGQCPQCLFALGFSGANRSLKQGDKFGAYRVVRELGSGGMGTVYEAEHVESGRVLAMKLLKGQFASEKDRVRFLREGQLAASINHPNSVYIYGTEEIEGIPVITMELVRGGTLESRVKKDGRLPAAEATRIVLQLIDGLEAAAAQGILHRDIKPSNCFLEPDGTPKVGDFGLALSTASNEANLDEEGKVWCSPGFASPEQIRGELLDVRSDIFSLGATFHFLLTGEVPFKERKSAKLLCKEIEAGPSPNLRKINPRISTRLAQLVLRCVSPYPKKRFGSYAELKRNVAKLQTSVSQSANLYARFLAGLLDSCALAALGFLLGVLMWLLDNDIKPTGVTAGVFCLRVLYFGISEGKWGATLGKRVIGIRVVEVGGSSVTIARGLLRSSLFNGIIFVVLPLLTKFFDHNSAEKLSLVPYGILTNPFFWMFLVLFITARKGNGYAGIHDILSATRVVEKVPADYRPINLEQTQIPPLLGTSTIGHFHLLESILAHPAGDLLLGYDERLRRRVWIRKTPSGTPSIPRSRCELARAGRLHWLAGQRVEDCSWDAYEAPLGKPLLDFLGKPQPWTVVRYWLIDLIKELAASLKDGSLPELTLHRVWITPDNRVKLVEFPICHESATALGGKDDKDQDLSRIKEFLLEFATFCLEGKTTELPGTVTRGLQVPLPQHARTFLESIPTIEGVDDLVSGIEPLLGKAAVISRSKRAIMLLSCAIVVSIPGWFAIEFLFFSQHSSPAVECFLVCGVTWFFFAAMWFGGGADQRLDSYRGLDFLFNTKFLLHALGIVVVRSNGQMASSHLIERRRCVTWSPFLLLTVVWAVLVFGFPPNAVLPWLIGKVVMAMLMLVFAAGVVCSVVTPNRTWADRIVGTCLVPV